MRDHAERCWPRCRTEVLRWTRGGLRENLPDLALVRVAPDGPGKPWVHLSAGASLERMDDGYGLEFLLLAPEPSPDALKLLAMVAHLHGDPRYPLTLGQPLEIGHPWLEGATCDHLLVCLADGFAQEVEWYSDARRNIRFVWLVPISADEAELARQRGYGAVLEALGRARLDPADAKRPSSV